MQQVKTNDHRCCEFAAWALERQTENYFFYRNVMFSDWFWLDGYLQAKLQNLEPGYAETPLYAAKVMVWCAIHARVVLIKGSVLP